MSELAQSEVAVFNAARRLTGDERSAYLEEACAGNSAMRHRLEELLGVDEAAGGFLENPAQADPTALAMLGETIRLSLPLSEKPGDRIGPYKLLEKVGEGGCGVVYVAEQEMPVRRRVALKIIKLGMDTKAVVARFEAERQALAMMDHPNIAKVFDAGATETGRPFFVMELVRGIRITDYCDQANLSTQERLDLFIKVCQAIQHAHQKGIIHRDIKPSNILVTLHDGVPVPKVIDFGIAKATEGRLTDATVYTQLHQFIGTPAYMSPEQAEMSGLDIDTRSDIYSLGVLLYELLAGSTPFDAQALMAAGIDAMRKTIREQEPVRPSTRLATLQGAELTTAARHRSAEAPKLIHLLKGDLDWIVMRCLEKDRTRRYETAIGLAADLKRHLQNEPVVARPPSNLYRFQKMFRRNRLPFTAGFAFLITLFTGISVSTWQAVKARQALRIAEAAVASEKEGRLAEQRQLYVANMTLLQQAWEQNNIRRVRQLLEETATYPDRGYEWYYWQRQTHLEQLTIFPLCDRLLSVAFSPDGRRLFIRSLAEIQVHDAINGKKLFTLGHDLYNFGSMVFSPNGEQIASGSSDGTVKVWDVATAGELLSLKGHPGRVVSLAFSTDGTQILARSLDENEKMWRVKTWDSMSGKELADSETPNEGRSSVAFPTVFSPDGHLAVSAGGKAHDGQTAILWEVATGRKLFVLNGHSSPIEYVIFSPEGGRIVTGSPDQTANVWETASGKSLFTIKGEAGHVAAFSPDGRRIVTGGRDRLTKVWDATTGVQLLAFKGHLDSIIDVAISPDGRRIATASMDQTVKVWETTNGWDRLTLETNGGRIVSAAFLPDGTHIVTGGDDGTISIWEASSGKEVFNFVTLDETITSLVVSPDGQRIVPGFMEDSVVRVFDLFSGRELPAIEEDYGQYSRAVAFSPDGKQIAGFGLGVTKVWETASGKRSLTLDAHDGLAVCAIAFSRERIVTSGEHGSQVWDAVKGSKLFRLQPDPRLEDGKFSTISPDGHGYVDAVAFSPDGQRIVTGSEDQTARVWDAATGKELLVLRGHSDGIRFVAFSSSGHRILTGSDDGTAKVWEAATGKELLTLVGHGLAFAFSPDDQRILTGSFDGTANVWLAASKEQVAVWQREDKSSKEVWVKTR